MTSTPGDDQAPKDPQDPSHPPQDQPSDQEEPGYWQQQGQQPGQQGPPPPGGYGYPPAPGAYPQTSASYTPDHPKATTVLILGILGVVLCQVLGPFAWVMGRRTLGEIDASEGRLGGRGSAQAGYILGIVGTVLLAMGVLVLVAYLVFALAFFSGGVATSP